MLGLQLRRNPDGGHGSRGNITPSVPASLTEIETSAKTRMTVIVTFNLLVPLRPGLHFDLVLLDDTNFTSHPLTLEGNRPGVAFTQKTRSLRRVFLYTNTMITRQKMLCHLASVGMTCDHLHGNSSLFALWV